jgi:hypothetical protein
MNKMIIKERGLINIIRKYMKEIIHNHKEDINNLNFK